MITMKDVLGKGNGKKNLPKFSSDIETTVRVVAFVLLDEVGAVTLNVLIALFELLKEYFIPYNSLHVIQLFQLLSQLVWEDIFSVICPLCILLGL